MSIRIGGGQGALKGANDIHRSLTFGQESIYFPIVMVNKIFITFGYHSLCQLSSLIDQVRGREENINYAQVSEMWVRALSLMN